jgi:hypothetical protein
MEFNLLPQIAGACGGSLYPETPPFAYCSMRDILAQYRLPVVLVIKWIALIHRQIINLKKKTLTGKLQREGI